MCKGRSWYARFCLASKGIKLHQLIRGKEKVSGDLFPRLLRTSFQDLNFFLFFSTRISDTQPLVKSVFNTQPTRTRARAKRFIITLRNQDRKIDRADQSYSSRPRFAVSSPRFVRFLTNQALVPSRDCENKFASYAGEKFDIR